MVPSYTRPHGAAARWCGTFAPDRMSITITIATSVSAADYARIEQLAEVLREKDGNFRGRAVTVERGPTTAITDTQDKLRGALLQLLVEGVLSRGF